MLSVGMDRGVQGRSASGTTVDVGNGIGIRDGSGRRSEYSSDVLRMNV